MITDGCELLTTRIGSLGVELWPTTCEARSSIPGTGEITLNKF